MKYDFLLKWLPGIAWCVLGLLGWSLDSQIRDFRDNFKDKLSEVKTEVSALEHTVAKNSDGQTKLSESFARLETKHNSSSKLLERVDESDRRLSERLSRVEVFVTELLQIRREERQVQNNKNGGR